MQVSRREAARALMILRRTQRRTSARRRRRLRPHRGGAPGTDPSTSCRTTVDHSTIESIHRHLLDDRNWVSIERTGAAQARLVAGEGPSAAVVADMMVRRAICDRLS
jgi:hypothetical protein